MTDTDIIDFVIESKATIGSCEPASKDWLVVLCSDVASKRGNFKNFDLRRAAEEAYDFTRKGIK